MNRHQRLTFGPMALLVLLCALWGVQQVAVKVAVTDGMPPLLMACLRSVVASVCLTGWMLAREGSATLRAMLLRTALLPGLLLGLCFGLEFLVLYPALALTTASRGVLFFYTAPFFTALGAHVFLPQERLRLRQGVGLLIAFAGLALAFADGFRVGEGSLLGDAMCVLAGFLWGGTTVLIKAHPGLRSAPASHILLYQVAGSAPLLLIAAGWHGDFSSPLNATALAWISLAYQAVIVTFASYLAWFWLVMRYQAAAVSGFTFLVPLFGIATGAALLGETPTPALLLGLVAVAVGMRFLR